VLIVHYSCGLFGQGNQPAAVDHIVIRHAAMGHFETFDVRTYGGEAEMLERFANFVTANERAIWVSWKMRGAHFGFDALARRKEHIRRGGTPLTVPPEQRIDTAKLCKAIYGEYYAAHPRFASLASLNGLTDNKFLSSEAAEAAWQAGEHERLRASTEKKVRMIESLFLLLVEGKLRVQDAAVPVGPAALDLVTLDEAAAIVHRVKRTLERHLSRMPLPHVQGGGGKPSLWRWADLRPWLQREYLPDLPERFPRNVR
jgi:hypothetical protein